MVLTDNYGRPLLNLRIAITSRCNLSCNYCHKEGEEETIRQQYQEMKAEEIVRIARIAINLGISRIKITGGEPLIRRDIVEIVRGISTISGLRDLSLTTNGTMLSYMAPLLVAAGLKRVNISLPSLDRETYHELTDGKLEDALAGVQVAIKVGLWPVKLNMVVLNDINDHRIQKMIEFARNAGAILQLIELDPINVKEQYYSIHYKSLDSYEETLRQKALKIQTRRFMHNRHIYYLPDAIVEVVHPIENTEFCAHCTRLRVTSDGKLKPCLMRNDNVVDILTSIRKGANDKELEGLFRIGNTRRKPYNESAQNQN